MMHAQLLILLLASTAPGVLSTGDGDRHDSHHHRPVPTGSRPSPSNATAPHGFLARNKKRDFKFAIPPSQGKVVYKTAYQYSGVFDGHMKTYDRGTACTGQTEGDDSAAVFLLNPGATLKNAIIGAYQSEGVHCLGSCTIENVWWVKVCEDALTLKGDGDATIKGGGAQGATDKVIQHNGHGTVTIDGFHVQHFGKLYRSCGDCKDNHGASRHVVVTNVKAADGKVLVGINRNYHDTAKISSTCATNVKLICEDFEGSDKTNKSTKAGHGPDSSCQFTSPLPECA